MRLLRPTLAAAAVTVLTVLSAQAVASTSAIVVRSPDIRDAEVLAQFEVRGHSSTPPMGRSVEIDEMTPALTEPETATPGSDARLAPTAQPAPSPAPSPAPFPADLPAVAVSDDPELLTRGEAALDLISYPWRSHLPGWIIAFEPELSGMRGLTFSGDQRIEVYVRADESPWEIARVVAHELGHAVDLTYGSVVARKDWRELRGLPADTPWWPDSRHADFATGAGDFAECFATAQVGSATLSHIGEACTDEQMAAAVSLGDRDSR